MTIPDFQTIMLLKLSFGGNGVVKNLPLHNYRIISIQANQLENG